jgi:hypothetical protein
MTACADLQRHRREPGADGGVRDRSGGIETVVFDVLGVGGSPAPTLAVPLRGLGPAGQPAGDATRLRRPGRHARVSWGGRAGTTVSSGTRRLVLTATSPGDLMVPGSRCSSPEFLGRIGAELSVGGFGRKPNLLLDQRPPLPRTTRVGNPCLLLGGWGWISCSGWHCWASRRWSWRAPRIRSCRSSTPGSWPHSLVRQGFM